jgi:hypothetical protein
VVASKSPDNSFDAIAEAIAKDLDRALLKRSLARTPTERIAWLESMQALAKEARPARDAARDAAREAARAAAPAVAPAAGRPAHAVSTDAEES